MGVVMSPYDPRLTIIANEARVKTCHVYHCYMAMREMKAGFHVAAFAHFTGLEERHVERIMAALAEHEIKPTKRAASPRGARLPDDWQCPKEWIDWACAERRWYPHEVEKIAEGFADYWHSLSGQRACKLDWRKTWQNWVRNQNKPDGDYRPAEKRKSPEEWIAYCEERVCRYKDADYPQGVREWQEKLEAARANNVVQLRNSG